MNMPHRDVRLPSVALDIVTRIEAEERELDRLLNLYVKFEEGWNERFKAVTHGGDNADLAKLQEERVACEVNLGIEAVVDRASRLREVRNVLSDLVGMAAAGVSREDIAAHAEHFFGGRCGSAGWSAGPIGLEAWWLAGSLLKWVNSSPHRGREADIDIRITWRELERLATRASG